MICDIKHVKTSVQSSDVISVRSLDVTSVQRMDVISDMSNVRNADTNLIILQKFKPVLRRLGRQNSANYPPKLGAPIGANESGISSVPNGKKARA